MTDCLTHRGPDDFGHYVSGTVGLGHRRLSIVDLAAGHQPMCNEDESNWIVFNGEIYNHAEIRPSLEQSGHQYRTRSDTETIIHLMEEHGIAGLTKLRGMFAFALWNQRDRSLLLARDHTGIKPLYYAQLDNGSLVFGSEIKALFASGELEPELAPEFVEEYLTTGHVSREATLYRGVRKLEPGTCLVWRDGQYTIRPYWAISELSTPQSHGGSVAELAAQFWSRFTDSVASQLMSDVPLGVFLSGGLDSSLIVAAMREAGVDRIQSFSVGYREADASELPWARLVAKRMETDHHEVLVNGSDFFDDLPDLTWQRDLPLTFSASIPLYHVSKLAASHVKVVLTGEGSDELFAGYGRYPRALMNLKWARRMDRLLPGFIRRTVATAAGRDWSGYLGSRVARSFLAKEGSFEASCLEPFAEFVGSERSSVLLPELRTSARFGNLSTLVDDKLVESSPLEAMLRYDQRTYLEELLMKQDSMSMTASLESRVPFLDHKLVEWAATVPAFAKLDGATGKALVRLAAREHLPEEVAYGQKRGFLVPLSQWLRTVGKEMLESFMPLDGDDLFVARNVRRILDEHVAGHDRSGRIWRLLAFQVWRADTLPRMRRLAEQGRARIMAEAGS